MEIDYKKIGFKCGIEIHKQINTSKLFCRCPSVLRNDKPDIRFKRYLRPVAGELGKIDVAALYEKAKDRYCIYEAYSDTNCLVETDENPPQRMNQEALDSALEVALILNSKIVNEVHVMRKTVLDYSNTSGFQRTALIAKDGFIKTSAGKIGIEIICLEEDAARKIKETKKYVVYRLDRLGIPLIEIATAPDIKTPQQAKEVAKKLGMILKSTEKMKSGIGTIRQDLNLSIKDGARVEIKGVQDLQSIPKVIENEVKRQLNLLKKHKKVESGVRKANTDNTTSYMRPLPGASRLYPETDVTYEAVDKKRLLEIRSKLSEILEDKKERFKREFNLNEELANQVIHSRYLNLFEKFVKEFKIKPKYVANIFVNVLPDLKRRENIDISRIKPEHLGDVLRLLNKKSIIKDSLPVLFKEICIHPAKTVDSVIKEKKLKKISEKEAKKIIKKIISSSKTKNKKELIQKTMTELKGKIENKKIIEIVNSILD